MNRVRAFLLGLSLVPWVFAQQRQDKVIQNLIGAWRLVSVQGTDATTHLAFDRPTGLLVYDRSGRIVQIAVQRDRKPFRNGPASGTLEEKAAAFGNYAAYFGTYTVNLKEQTITHHIEEYSNPSLRGVNNVRWFEFQGNNRLLLIPREDGKGGVIDRKTATYRLLWERIR